VRYQLTDDATQKMVRVEIEIWTDRAANLTARPDQSGSLIVGGDSATFTAQAGSRSENQRYRVQPDAVPLLDVAVGLEERLVRRAHQSGRTLVDIPTFYIASGGYSPTARVTFISRDSVRVQFGSDIVADLRTDSVGRILRGWYRSATTSPTRVIRVPCQLIDGILGHPIQRR
jgi:hypothetical protein